MFNALSPAFKGLVLGLTGYSLFTVVDMLVKFVAPYYSIAQIVGIQSFISIVILLTLSKHLGGIKSAGNIQHIKIHILRGFIGVALAMISTYCFANLPLTTVYTAIFSQPFFAIILAALIYKEKTSLKHWLIIIVGFIGVLIAFRPWENTIPLLLMGLLMAFPIIIAAMYIVMRSLNGASLFAIGIFPVTIGFLATLPFAINGLQLHAPEHLLIITIMAIFSISGFLALSTAYKIAEASVAASSHYVQMLWGLVWGYFIFGDVPSWQMLIGAAIIIASGVYLILHEKKISKTAAASPNTPSAS